MKKWLGMMTIVALAGVSQAATLKQGTRELTVDGLFDPEGPGGTVLALDLGYGYFIEDNIEVGAAVAFADTGASTVFEIAGFGEMNFDQGTETVPFVGASLGLAKADFDGPYENNNAVVLSGYAGVKYFLTDNVAITGQLEVDLATADIYVNDDNLDSLDVSLTIGMRFFLP